MEFVEEGEEKTLKLNSFLPPKKASFDTDYCH